MAAQYQQTILIAGDTKQLEQALTRIFKKIGLIQKKKLHCLMELYLKCGLHLLH